MSFYRTLLASLSVVLIASPVFAQDATMQPQPANDNNTMTTQQTPAASNTDMSSTEMTKTNINTASAKELMKVKGINAARARAIIAYRKRHGDFTSTNDLSKVKGFKKVKAAKMQAIQSQLSVE